MQIDTDTESRSVGVYGGGARRRSGDMSEETQFLFRADENVLKLTVMMVAQVHIYSKNP